MDNKFSELVLAICASNDDNCGATKLNKLLFFIDEEAYLELGETISGQEYRRLAHGPVPKQVVQITNELAKKGDLVVKCKTLSKFIQKKPIAQRPPNLSLFTKNEINIIQRVLEKYRNETARKVRSISHKHIGWKLAENNETIPIQTAFISNRSLTKGEKDYSLCLTDLPEYKQLYA